MGISSRKRAKGTSLRLKLIALKLAGVIESIGEGQTVEEIIRSEDVSKSQMGIQNGAAQLSSLKLSK